MRNRVYTSNHVLQRLKNAVCHIQSTIQPLFKAIMNNLKAWIDDFALQTKLEDKLLEVLHKFFEICQKTGLTISAKNVIF